MAAVPTYFKDFLANIRLDDEHRETAAKAQNELRERLEEDDELAPAIVATFLQGSYARSTIVMPADGEQADVDVVVVTRMHQDDYPRPEDAMKRFVPFVERFYPGQHRLQGRSIGIVLPGVDLDLVITSAPSEAEEGLFKSLGDATEWSVTDAFEDLGISRALMKSLSDARGWRAEPLFIPDRDAQAWQATHPLAQLDWTAGKNARCSGHYVNVVKAFKWWRRVRCLTPKYPKGYPVEHMIGVNCPDGISSVAEGLTLTLESIAANYAEHASRNEVPFLPDHGVPEHDVLKRIEGTDFAQFHGQVTAAAATARAALTAESIEESVDLWRELFGDDFPPFAGGGNGKGFTPRSGPSNVRSSPRFG